MRFLLTLLTPGLPGLTLAHELGDQFGPLANIAHHWFGLHHLPALVLVLAILLAVVLAVRKSSSKS